MEWLNQDYAILLKTAKDNIFQKIINYLFLLILCSSFFACNSLPQKETVTAEIDTLPFYISPDFTPYWVGKTAAEYERIHTVADFAFTNQSGETISQETVKGKIYVTDFIFTACPGICPKMMNNMVKVQEAFKGDDNVLLLSHSVTPEIDSVKALKKFGERNGAIEGKWHLLTGERKAIYDIARKSYFADEDLGFSRDGNDFLHTENFILVDGQRRIRGIYNGVLPAEVDRLIEDIHTLKLEIDDGY